MNKQAFTLIELLVVVLIIGILAAVALPQYQRAVKKAQYAQLLVTGRAIADAEEVYYLANNEYATDLDDLDIQIGNEVVIYLAVDNTTKHAAFEMTKEGLPLLAWYFKNHSLGKESSYRGKRFCRIMTSNEKDIYHGLCKSISGLSAGSTHSGYIDYELN